MYERIDEHTKNILCEHLEHNPDWEAIIIYDEECDLAKALYKSYEKNLENVQSFNFMNAEPEALIEEINKLQSGRLVILVQTGSFRMSTFRWRLELFHRNLKVIEHARLGHNTPEEAQTYIDSLTCDITDNSRIANILIPLVDTAKQLVFTSSDGSEFIVDGPFEDVKPNLGTYLPTQHKGGGFPVGEIFSEPKDLEAFNGSLLVRAFPSMDHKTVICTPFKVTFEKGRMTSIADDAPAEFLELMKLPQSENEDGDIRVREVGLGLNKHISFDKPLHEVTAFERMRGLHFSLGMKHNIYRKKVPKTVNQRFHIDIFVDVVKMRADDKVFFEDGEYVL